MDRNTYSVDILGLGLGQRLVDHGVVLARLGVEHQLGGVDGVGALDTGAGPLRGGDHVVVQLELAQLLGEVDGAGGAGADGGGRVGLGDEALRAGRDGHLLQREEDEREALGGLGGRHDGRVPVRPGAAQYGAGMSSKPYSTY